MNHAGDIFEGTEQDIRDFMDSKGYAFVERIRIDEIFLKKELMKKWPLGPFKYYVIKEVGGWGCQMMMFDDKVGG